MGTFGSYSGQLRLKNEEKDQFAKQVMKLLNYGGMMSFEEVSMYGSELGLLIPAEIFQGGECRFWYNYFEDDVWEPAGFNADDCSFRSEKIGSQEFNDVVTAVNFLYELYDENPGFAEINGEIVNSTDYVGWINHLLGTDFSMKKRFNLWENAEYYVFQRMKQRYNDPMDGVMNIIPDGMERYAISTELADLMYVKEGADALKEAEDAPGSYAADVHACRKAIYGFLYSADSPDDAVSRLMELVRSRRKQRAECGDSRLKKIAGYSLILPARVIVYLVAEYQKKNFWVLWKEIYKDVYHDEVMKSYFSGKPEGEWRRAIEAPIPPVRTSDFLRQDNWFTFRRTPEELKGKPNYYVSDDDRLYWWDGSDEVIISNETDKWLKDLAEEHHSLMCEKTEGKPEMEPFFEKFLKLLIEADKYYQRIYLFRSMFYEFLDHGNSPEYSAAVELFGRLVERNKEAGKIIEKVDGAWGLASRNVTHNAGRMQLKRYLSVMANRKLRLKYFGF